MAEYYLLAGTAAIMGGEGLNHPATWRDRQDGDAFSSLTFLPQPHRGWMMKEGVNGRG